MDISFGSRFDHKSRVIYIRNLKIKIKKELAEQENKKLKKAQVEKKKSTEIVEKPVVAVFKKKNKEEEKKEKDEKKTEPVKEIPQVKEEQPIRIVIPKKEEKKTEEVSKKIEKPLISKEPQIEIKIEPKKVEQPVIIQKPKIEIKKEPKKEQMPIPKPQPEITKEEPKKVEQPIVNKEPVKKENLKEEKIEETKEESKDKSKFGTLKYSSIGNKTPREEKRDKILVDHVNELIKESNKKIYDLTLRKSELEDQIDKAKTKEEQEDLKEELERLKKELENLIKQVEFYKFEFDKRYLDSIGLTLESKKSDRTIIGKERYLGVYNEIMKDILKCETIIEEAQKENLEKLEEYEDRDKVYEEFKKIVEDHDKIDNNLKNVIENQKKEFLVLRAKLRNATTIEERTRIVSERIRINMNRNIAVILAAKAAKIPMTPVLRALAVTNTIEVLGQMVNPNIRVETELVTETKDYSSELEKFNMDIKQSKLSLEASKQEIKKIMGDFKQLESHPDYDELVKNCDEILVIIEENEYELDKLDENLQKENELAEAKTL